MRSSRGGGKIGDAPFQGFLVALLAACVVGFAPRGARADDDSFFLKGGERVVFFGDSITQAGGYVADVEVFLLTRFPDRSFTLVNHGISSETISGTSETDHHPRRPDAQRRFTRDVAAWKPDVVVACFGMNDGNYHPFEPVRFAKYQEGVRRLIERTRIETHARLVILTPPPFDPYRRTASDPNAKEYGYKFPAIDYDKTLGHYSQWLLTLPRERKDLVVVDVHRALNEHLSQRRRSQASFFLSGDAVHPGPTGHWLMAQALLLAWNAPALVAEARINTGSGSLKVEAGAVRDLMRGTDGTVELTWRSPLPLAFDPAWDARSIEQENLPDRLNRYRLAVAGLTAPRYEVHARFTDVAEDSKIGEFTREQLARGLDLTALDRFPTVALAAQVRKRVLARRQKVDGDWRRGIAQAKSNESSSSATGGDPELIELRGLCQPRDLRLRLVPSK